MIVIASHNNIDLVSNLLAQLHDIDLNGHEILVVDTNSTDTEYLELISSVVGQYKDVTFVKKDYKCFDSGAYIHAYLNYTSNRYIFLQDSISIVDKDIILKWDKLLDSSDVVPMYNFEFGYDNDDQKIWSEDMINHTSYPEFGIFGPIFAINRYALDIIPRDWLKDPHCKMHACAMERRWSLIFHVLGMKIHFMVHMNKNEIWEFLNGHAPKYAYFLEKHFYNTKR